MDLEKLVGFIRARKDPFIVIALCTGAVLGAYYFFSVLAPFVIALVLAYLLDPVVRWLQKISIGRHHPKRMTCVLVIYILLFTLFISIGLPILVNVTNGLIQIAQALDSANLREQALSLLSRYQKLLKEMPLPDEIRTRLNNLVKDPEAESDILVAVFNKFRLYLTSVLRKGARFITNILSAGMQLALVPVLLFYFMLEFDTLDDDFIAIVPASYRPWALNFLDRVDRRLGGFIRGQLLIATIFGSIMTLGLWLIGIRYAVILGPLSGIANLVPYLGVVVGLVPAFFLAVWQGGISVTSLWLCASILGLFVILQTLDGYVFQPRILGPSVELHPLWIMFALALGQQLMGLAGLILAVPVAAVLRVVLEDLYRLLYDSGEAAPADRSSPGAAATAAGAD